MGAGPDADTGTAVQGYHLADHAGHHLVRDRLHGTPHPAHRPPKSRQPAFAPGAPHPEKIPALDTRAPGRQTRSGQVHPAGRFSQPQLPAREAGRPETACRNTTCRETIRRDAVRRETARNTTGRNTARQGTAIRWHAAAPHAQSRLRPPATPPPPVPDKKKPSSPHGEEGSSLSDGGPDYLRFGFSTPHWSIAGSTPMAITSSRSLQRCS